MGLFDGLKMMGDIVKGGIAMAKACEKLDELTLKAVSEYDKFFTPKQKEMYANYKLLKDKQEATEDVDTQNAMSDEVEGAQIYFLSSLSRNARIPQEFKNELISAIDTYKKADTEATQRVKKRMLKMAKTDEERRSIEQAFQD